MRYSIILAIILFVSSKLQAQSESTKQALLLMENGFVVSAVELLRKGDRVDNDIWAQFFLAQCYELGYGLNQDLPQAFKFYRKSAERGLAVAQSKLSSFYSEGKTVYSNPDKATYWRNKAEGKFDVSHLTFLTNLYQEGLKHPENYALNPYDVCAVDNNVSSSRQNSNTNSNNVIGSNNQTINNITIIQTAPTQPAVHTPAPVTNPETSLTKSDVDQNIPTTTIKNANTFALIIANENYQDVAKVPNALNDGEIFAEYCRKTLGLPASNVILVKDATFNNIRREINKLSQIADAYKGTAKIIFYYAGHGIPNEATKDAFLLPVDGYGTDTSTGYSLKELYAILGNLPVQQVVVLLDACFSGSQRGNGMLASARGVVIKTKPNKVDGKMVVISAAQGDETAYPYQEEGHGMFTYYLLKKLKETKGDVTLGDLASYITDNVTKKSIVVNGKSQTPNVNPSASLGESWKTWTLK